ncbi:MAG TPA: DUF3800 domain-containing protein [Candidatus Didemnitutus sp.]|nr:DUF3800 domain-containing protein [Candidatus Didemnitutus sp.]
MLVFIDESGDPGMPPGGGCSEYFTVTMVLVEDHEEAAAIDQRIALLRHELGLPEHFEFHFSKLKRAWREEFFRVLGTYQWFHFAVVLNKAKLTGKGFQFPDPFYKYTCSLVFQNAKPYLRDAIVVIDGSGGREFRTQLSTYLRKRVNEGGAEPKFIRKVKLQDSRQNSLLQLADMVCGAVARKYTNPSEKPPIYNLISHREMQVQFWPK